MPLPNAMHNIRMSEILFSDIPDLIVTAEEARPWRRIYYGADFPVVRGSSTFRIRHRDWWCTPSCMTDEDFERAEHVLHINLFAHCVRVQREMEQRQAQYAAARVAPRPRRPKYIAHYTVEPLPLPE